MMFVNEDESIICLTNSNFEQYEIYFVKSIFYLTNDMFKDNKNVYELQFRYIQRFFRYEDRYFNALQK